MRCILKFKNLIFKKGFTLLEVIVSLFVLSLLMHSLMLVYDSYDRIETEIRADYSADFLHFLTLLELELNNYHIKEVQPKQIHLVKQKTNANSRLIQQNGKIYFTPGHQPLAYNIKDWELFNIYNKLHVTVTYNNKQLFTGLINIQYDEDINNDT